jgi:hypothetical protein
MKKIVAVLALVLSFVSGHWASADSGLGVILGGPTGISGRTSLDSQHSLDLALAYSHHPYYGFYIHGTYLRDAARLFPVANNNAPLELYYGLGLRVISINKGKYDGDIAVGPRAPVGLLYNINNPNLELFGEISLALDIVPRTEVDLDVGVGVRFRF